ncbi:metal ABC transporter substrate-binding protein [Anaerosporobacter mobilis]|uniref:metal ABC transporter substrate-binding protein n=1 Tax=Anaerosporobacter mobilis TaxID=264463 RepID=UPI001A9A4541|nr:metal ABC transporter substrate-binding protein [Anaerosporobacter mobilis]
METTDSKVAGDNTSKIKVVTTLFPQYDFANQVGKDAVEVKMLLKPGVESHTYEPAPSDIIEINKADIFLYTGDEMEPWVSKILDSLDSDVMIIDLSKNITLDKVGDHDHEHEDEESDGDHLHEDESEEAEHEEDHVHSYDPHIWTNPLNAKIMVEDIKTALSEVDKANKMTYENNAKDYLASLDQLDQDIREVVKQAKRDEVVFGGRFAFHYFFEEYGLDYVSAYDSCSSETEPSAKVIATIIDKVKEDQIPVIFYEEFANPKVAESIANATGAKTLLLHSCHNVSTDDYKNGATYLSLMYQNLENLKEALN